MVFIGWTLLILVGQWLLPRESFKLQWLAVVWMWAGVWLVRRASCLPFLLMTLPVFMCEIHRPWAWTQVVTAWGFLLRILIESRPARREWILLAAVGAVTVFFSWPMDYADRIAGLMEFSKSELVHQWMQPQAVWAIFPFRQTADRALFVWLCALLVSRKDYFSTQRLAGAFIYAMVMAILANYATVILPWHQPHIFLGTSNYGAFKGRLLHGAGYNQHFMSLVIALGLPWLFIPLNRKRAAIGIGLIGLAIPLIFIEQLAFRLILLTLVLLGLAFTAPAVWSRVRRKKMLFHYRLPAGYRWAAALVFLLSFGVTFVWGYRLNADTRYPLLRLQVRRLVASAWPGARDRMTTRLLKDGPLTKSTKWQLKSMARASPGAQYRMAERLLESDQLSEEQKRRLREHMKRHSPIEGAQRTDGAMDEWAGLGSQFEQVDASRTRMWRLALRRFRKHPLWRGAGAGTWATFHRDARRTRRIYFAHAHNTYIDLIFEYGVLPMAALFTLGFVSFLRVWRRKGSLGRLWISYFAVLAVFALGQHLFYAFTTMCAVIPAVVLLCRAWLPAEGEKAAAPLAG